MSGSELEQPESQSLFQQTSLGDKLGAAVIVSLLLLSQWYVFVVAILEPTAESIGTVVGLCVGASVVYLVLLKLATKF